MCTPELEEMELLLKNIIIPTGMKMTIVLLQSFKIHTGTIDSGCGGDR